MSFESSEIKKIFEHLAAIPVRENRKWNFNLFGDTQENVENNLLKIGEEAAEDLKVAEQLALTENQEEIEKRILNCRIILERIKSKKILLSPLVEKILGLGYGTLMLGYFLHFSSQLDTILQVVMLIILLVFISDWILSASVNERKKAVARELFILESAINIIEENR